MPNLRLTQTQMPTTDMDIVVATMVGMAVEDTMAMERGLLWLSQTLMLNLNLMAMATTATTDPMGTGVGEGRGDLLSPMLWLNLQLMLNLRLTLMPTMDMDIVVATMADMAEEDTMAGGGKRGLPSPTMDTADMDMAVGTMADTVEDIGAKP